MTARPCDHSAIGAALALPAPPAPASVPNRTGLRDQGLGIRDKEAGKHRHSSSLSPDPRPLTPDVGIRDQGSGTRDKHDGAHRASSSLPPTPRPLTPSPFRLHGRSARSRRGVLLLVVLSLLVLFTLIAVTFVLVASQSRRSVRADSRNEQYGDDPQKQLDSVFAQLVRDTVNPQSALRGHSLLADIYGNDGAKGTISSAAAVAGGQFYDLQVASLTDLFGNAYPAGSTVQTPGYFNGCVLTILSGPAANLSTRIVGWAYIGGGYQIRIMAFQWRTQQDPTNFTAASAAGSGFLINGQPFNGTGFGLPAPAAIVPNAPTLLTAGAISGVPGAFLLNPVFSPTTVNPFGGPDEDYDAPDPQNMALAYSPITLPATVPGPGNPSPILPSFHRQDLVQYLATTNNAAWTDPNVARRVMLRPLGKMTTNGTNYPSPDHPNFTGSNPGSPAYPGVLDAANGPWDIDNDGDGIPDSVWIDPGFPAQTAPDGRRFKVLAAIYATDLDGRLNVNAHGSIAQLEPNYLTLPASIPATYYAGGSVPNLMRGQAYGPAEINLGVIFGRYRTPADAAYSRYAAIFAGNANYTGRYGEPNRYANLSTLPGYPNTGAAPGNLPPYPGITTFDDPLNAITQLEFPAAGYPNLPSAYATPPDLAGRGTVALDVRGTPLTPYMGTTSDTIDDPYELDLGRRFIRSAMPLNASTTATGPADAPFSASELEAILRIYDLDTSVLPARLKSMLANVPPATALRMLTTDSVDLPSPSLLPTRDHLAAAGGLGIGTQHLVDLLKIRLAQNGFAGNLALAVQQLLPPEVVAGQRLDINRPFGNGYDDNGNGVVDEPAEAGSGTEPAWLANANAAKHPSVPNAFVGAPPFFEANNGLDANGDNISNTTDRRLARHLFARHLYVLMMLLKDQAALIDFDGDGNSNAEETARGIAQWAVNVVDFRDRDSIMTPFEYDFNPFNTDGWSVDGILGTFDDNDPVGHPDRRIVWGCERPELLITETLAFHDRRTEDLPSPESTVAGAMGSGKDAPDGTTKDFDQRLRPKGSLFIELYNPWNTQTSTLNNGFPSVAEAPGEFYNVAANEANGNVNLPNPQIASGIQLNATTPGNTPVWRLIIVKGASIPADPDDFGVSPPLPFQKADVERTVYFANPQLVTDLPTLANHYTSTTLPIAPLMPGRYAVVGSAGQPGLNTATEFITPIGRLNANFGASSDGIVTGLRQIVLAPNVNPLVNQVEVRNNFGVNQEPTATGDLLPAVAVVVDSTWNGTTTIPLSASISEPVIGYVAGGYDPLLAAGEGAFNPPLNIPLDEGNLDLDGTRLNYRMIHLQRLADPTLDWNASTNPYLTVDSMSVDLTVFNGVADPAQPRDPHTSPGLIGVSSYQRGDAVPSAVVSPQTLLWSHQPLNGPVPPVGIPPSGGSQHIVNFALKHSLGYVNTRFGVAATATAYKTSDAPFGTYVGSPKVPPAGIGPFPWFAWNNRPFVSPIELMLVPKSRSSRLLFDFNSTSSSYALPAGPGPPAAAAQPLQLAGGHLLDFFQTNVPGNSATHFYRLLDLVQVPSRFTDSSVEISPSTVLPAATERDFFSLFHPPFNKVSNYRDFGRVNINTLPSDTADNPGLSSTSFIWQAIMNPPNVVPFPGLSPPNPTWQQVLASRQGQAGNTSTWFANPFRSPLGASFTLPGTQPRNERDVSLLRGANPAVPAGPPLFSYAQLNGATDDPIRNTYFQIANLQRLSNLLTTRSNVYAVWITVGYFEVTPWQPGIDTAHPDGYQLGAEIGSDSGEITRHRAFYIYDRSIPVGFEPGRDHNIDEGVLLKRFIE